MNTETYNTLHDTVLFASVKRVYNQIESIGYTVGQVDKQMVTVNGSDLKCSRLESFRRTIIHRNDIIAV